MFTRSLCLVAIAAPLFAGCSNQAFSPPAGWVPAEEPVPLALGKTSIGGGFGFGDVGLDAADFIGANLRYRHGIAPLLELQAEGAVVVFDEDTDEFPAILSARVGLKGSFVPDFPHIGWVGGLGFGGPAGRTLPAAAFGVQPRHRKPYPAPVVRGSPIASMPITSVEVDLRRPEDTDPILDHPVTTFGVRIGLGLSAHLGDSDARLHIGIANLPMVDIHGPDESTVGRPPGPEPPPRVKATAGRAADRRGCRGPRSGSKTAAEVSRARPIRRPLTLAVRPSAA